jgi:glycosyltransferase involved in cell wall biosynthesis
MKLGRPLLVIIPDRVSQIITKGEYQPRYYNPGGVFDDVHLLLTNDDQPDIAALQRTVGRARLTVHNLPEDENPMYLPPTLLGRWKRWHALRRWAEPAVQLARRINPALVRCHSADFNAFAASRIKRALGTPYVVSLHINPDINAVRRPPPQSLAEERRNLAWEDLEREGLRHADLALPVYRSILPYLDRLGIKRRQVAYNVLNSDYLAAKTEYTLHDPVRVISVGRQIPEKNPAPIIQAVARIPGMQLTLVGDGSIHDHLRDIVQKLGVSDRVLFEPAIANDRLCHMLPDFDIFAVHTEYAELNKSVLEGLLTGLPLIINRRSGVPVPELDQADFVFTVENTEESYYAALLELINNHDLRERLGRRAFARARADWAPEITEAAYVDIYRRLARHS